MGTVGCFGGGACNRLTAKEEQTNASSERLLGTVE